MPSRPIRLTSLAVSVLLLSCAAHAQTPVTLTQTMADPDWIGPPVEQAWWAWDGQRVQYQLKREGAAIRDTWQQPIAGGTATMLDGAARADLDAPRVAYDASRTRMAFVRNGDVFVRDLRNGTLMQVTRSNADEATPQWSSDGNLVFRQANDWYQWRAGRGVSQAAVVKAEKDPAADPKHDDLRERQLATIATLK